MQESETKDRQEERGRYVKKKMCRTRNQQKLMHIE